MALRRAAIARQGHCGVIDDYGYDNAQFDAYLAEAQAAHAKNITVRVGPASGEINLKMLLNKRIPIIIEHEAVMAYQLHRQGVPSDRVRNAGYLQQRLPLVIGFNRLNPSANQWVEAINQELESLRASGRLTQLKMKYHLPD